MRSRRGNEPGEQRMPVARVGGELRMELGGNKPRMISKLDDLDESIGRETRERQARRAVALEIGVVELVAMTMPSGCVARKSGSTR